MPNHQYPSEVWFDIETLTNVAQPRSIVTLGDFDTTFLSDYCVQKEVLGQTVEQTHYSNEPEKILHSDKRFDLAIAANLIEHTEKILALQILSRLRDVSTHQFCICLPLSVDGWQLHDMFALGLQRVAQYKRAEQHLALFKYNLHDYKKTPDWLNADNWANPEMWGKYSW